MVSSRQHWMDFVRGICIILVIFVHATTPVTDWAGLTFSEAVLHFNKFMGPFRIPLLMFLSGMLLHKSLDKSLSNYILGKFYLIFWPFLIWSIVVYASESRLTLEYILKTPISAPSFLWYLWFLFAFYLIALFLIKFSIPLPLIIILCVVGSAFLPSFIRIDRFFSLLPFFLMGHYTVSHSITSKIGSMLGLLGLILALGGGILSATGDSIIYKPLFIWVPLGLIIFILWSSKFFKSNVLTAPLEWVGRNSIVFYVIHLPVMVVTARLLSKHFELDGSTLYILIFIWAVTLGAYLQWLRTRSPIFAALFDFRVIMKLFRKASS